MGAPVTPLCATIDGKPVVSRLLPQDNEPPVTVDQALDALAAAGILFRRVPAARAHDIILIKGKPAMLNALHKREQQ